MPTSHCRACGQTFSCTAEFDRHRAGDFDTGRSCLPADALRGRGLAQDAHGVWMKPAKDAERAASEAVAAHAIALPDVSGEAAIARERSPCTLSLPPGRRRRTP